MSIKPNATPIYRRWGAVASRIEVINPDSGVRDKAASVLSKDAFWFSSVEEWLDQSLDLTSHSTGLSLPGW